MKQEGKAASGATDEIEREAAGRGDDGPAQTGPLERDTERDVKGSPERDDASVIAGETDIPVGTAGGESPGEQATAQAERKQSSGSTSKHAILVGAGILLSRLVGLVRQRVFAHYFGTSDAADAFNAAFRIPNFLQNIFGEGALSASFIPVYARLLAHDDREEATRVASAVLSVLALVTAVVVLVGVLTTPYLISLIAPGFEGEKRELTIRLVKIFFPGAGLLVLSAWCLGVLNSHRRFFLSYTAPVVWNFAIIASLIGFGRRMELFPLAEVVAWGSVIGSGLQFGVQLPVVLKLVKGLRPVLDIATANVRTVIRNFLPVFVSRGVVQISAFVDAWLASWLGTGAVAALAYTQSLYTLPVSLFGMSVSAAELPAMSSAVGSAEEVTAQLRQRLDAGLRQIAFFIVPSAMGFLALGDVMTGALYQTGKFQHDDVLYVWAILAGSSVGLLASTLGRLYSSTYYALHDTRTPLRYAALRVFLTIVLGYLCSIPLPRLLGIDQQWGAAGLTASAGVSGWIEFALLRRTLNRRIGRTGLPAAFVAQLWAAAAVSAALGWGVKLLIGARHPILVAAFVLGAYGLLYFGLTSALGLPEARTVVGRFTRLVRKPRG
ncbi:MAG TPA: murein biosynthesis integral membrane protein MurJ [Pyrinomonadaceae bacterium]|jgi:putative peptidoglycan lipid II flippase|nr:murein biosynthesis integral membrane protein MurJ [Pyrinomonadaceae bacterium]